MKISIARCRILVMSVMALSSAGCISIHAEQSFPVEQIRSIQTGTTTRQDILAWFGPPAAMARKGQSIRVPSIEKNDEELHDVVFKDILGYFPKKHDEDANLVIYLYQYRRFDIPHTFFDGAGLLAQGQRTIFLLWVLLDEDRNIVIDTAQRTQEPGEM